MINRLLVLSGYMLLMASCNMGLQKKDADYFILRGKLENAGQIKLEVHEMTTNKLIPVESFETDPRGNFSFRGRLDEAGFFVLRTDPSNYITLVVEPGEEIYLYGDAEDLPAFHEIKGSPGSALLSDLKSHLRLNYRKVDSLSEVFRESRAHENFMEIRQSLDQAYAEIYESQQQYVRQFIRDNPRSLASIIALYQYFGNQLLLREDTDFEYFELLSKSLSEEYPHNKHVLDLARRVSRQKRSELQRRMARENLAIGNEAPEIILPDTGGEMIALSSLHGNYVLIDFWATWCAPCREANPQLREIYDLYHGKGFEIYGISLDRTREQWLQGIKEDRINWIQLSDLRFWSSPVVSLYQVEGIPYNVLIDPEGRIVEKGISPGELEIVLADIFSD